MAKYFEDYDKNTFTTSSDDDKINKKNNSGSYPAFRKPVFRGNSNGVENRFHSANNTPVQSGNKPYSYGIPMSREDKIAQSLGRSLNTALTNEKNRVKAIADKMSRDIEKTKQRQNGTQSAKRSDTSFALQDKNEGSHKAEKLSVVTPVPKEQKIYSGTPVNPEYAISKTYGTEKEKDVFAVLKGMDEVTGKDDAGRYLRGRTEWLTHNHFDHLNQEGIQRKTGSMLDSGSLNAYGNYKKSNEKKNALNPDSRVSMEDDPAYVRTMYSGTAYNLSEGEKRINEKNGQMNVFTSSASYENFYNQRMRILKELDVPLNYLFEEKIEYETKLMKNYNSIVKRYGESEAYNLYTTLYDCRDSEEFNRDVRNFIIASKAMDKKNIRDNYEQINKRPVAYAITRLIEMKDAYKYTDDPFKKNLYAEAGKYLKAYILEHCKAFGNDYVESVISDTLAKEEVYDGKSTYRWIEALEVLLDNDYKIPEISLNSGTMTIDNLKLDLAQIMDCVASERPIVIYGRTHYTGNTQKIRYRSGGSIDKTVYPYVSMVYSEYSFEDNINNLNTGRS